MRLEESVLPGRFRSMLKGGWEVGSEVQLCVCLYTRIHLTPGGGHHHLDSCTDHLQERRNGYTPCSLWRLSKHRAMVPAKIIDVHGTARWKREGEWERLCACLIKGKPSVCYVCSHSSLGSPLHFQITIRNCGRSITANTSVSPSEIRLLTRQHVLARARTHTDTHANPTPTSLHDKPVSGHLFGTTREDVRAKRSTNLIIDLIDSFPDSSILLTSLRLRCRPLDQLVF